MTSAIILEVCVDAVEAASAAQEGGAGRVELCADLLEGGITPSSGTISLAREKLAIPIHVLIRPRGGDFCYSDSEFEVMQRDIEQAKYLGADAIVSGVLLPNGMIDVTRTRALIDLARPLSFTFHRAFDMTADPRAALETLIDLGVERLLTSGQEASAWEGSDLIGELVRQARGRTIVMAGGGINDRNAGRIIAQSGVAELHASARGSVESAMRYRQSGVYMGGALRPAEFDRQTTSTAAVRALLAAVGG